MPGITIEWPAELNEQGRPMLWFGSWLIGDDGAEGAWFYSGKGGEVGEYPIPAGVTGLRIRRWPSDGLDAEYADVLGLAGAPNLVASALDFDREQPFSLLKAHALA